MCVIGLLLVRLPMVPLVFALVGAKSSELQVKRKPHGWKRRETNHRARGTEEEFPLALGLTDVEFSVEPLLTLGF